MRAWGVKYELPDLTVRLVIVSALKTLKPSKGQPEPAVGCQAA